MQTDIKNDGGSSSVPEPKKRKGVRASIYILPNLVTATSLFCGFLAIKVASEGRFLSSPDASMQAFVNAAYLILIAGVCDGLDGSIARWTKTQSAFGVQFDSLSDLVSFGVAPAVLAYQFILHNFSRIGFAAAFVFTAAGTLRLARFNVQSSIGKASGNFTGIPIPMAAAPVAVYVLAQDTLRSLAFDVNVSQFEQKIARFLVNDQVNVYILFGIMLLLAFGMVSTFEYISTKSIKLPRKHPFTVFALILMAVVFLFSIDFTLTLIILLLIYCIHGPILWFFFKRHRGGEEEELFASIEEESEDDDEDLPS